MDIKEKIKNLPDTCGVYVMRSASGDILYIGKALSIRKRLYGHFRRLRQEAAASWLRKVDEIEYIPCDAEEQALILEATLIKEKKPKYNVALRDDKSFPYVIFTAETYPRVHVARPKKGTAGKVCGPFTNVRLLRSLLKMLRKLFPFRSCRVMPKRPCLYYHLKMCPGPCRGGVDASLYKESVDNVYRILSGDRKRLMRLLRRRMKEAAGNTEFERAARLRDTITAVNRLYSGGKEPDEFAVLKDVLHLRQVPMHIEAIDISNISGKEATGSVVVFRQGVPDKDSYRRYRIRTVQGADDYRMISEVVQRRFSRMKEEARPFPDLLLIDGGYGHVRTAYMRLREMGVDIPVIGLAKKNEEIWFPRAKRPLVLDKSSPALHLLQRARDEAHRFARKYHVLLRRKKMLGK